MYILVTNWVGYWDKPPNPPYYPRKFIRPNINTLRDVQRPSSSRSVGTMRPVSSVVGLAVSCRSGHRVKRCTSMSS